MLPIKTCPNRCLPLYLRPAAICKRIQSNYCPARITKGDLLDQDHNLAPLGLRPYLTASRLCPTKSKLLPRGGFTPQWRARTANDDGHSMRSDLRPAIRVGYLDVYLPHDWAWSLEHPAPENMSKLDRPEHFDQIAAFRGKHRSTNPIFYWPHSCHNCRYCGDIPASPYIWGWR